SGLCTKNAAMSSRVRATSPLLARRGGCASKKKSEASEAAQTGWWIRFNNISVDLEPPPRPLHQRKLRDIFLEVANAPPGQEGRSEVRMRITEIFYSIQGESTHVGKPCVFVRLTGCSLRCGYCDTKYSYAGGQEMGLAEV